jgi:hypothetical protein
MRLSLQRSELRRLFGTQVLRLNLTVCGIEAFLPRPENLTLDDFPKNGSETPRTFFGCQRVRWVVRGRPEGVLIVEYLSLDPEATPWAAPFASSCLSHFCGSG